MLEHLLSRPSGSHGCLCTFAWTARGRRAGGSGNYLLRARVCPDTPTRWMGVYWTPAGQPATDAEETVMQILIKVLGIAALIWIGFTVLGWVLGLAFKLLFWALVIGAGVLIGSAVYGAVKSKPDRKALR